MSNEWRLLDTGIKNASENIALDPAILKAKSKGQIPNTLRFLQFSPPAALIGYHQTIEQEIRLEYCKEKGIDINRRITGGGAIYFDQGQLGWEVICSREDIGYKTQDLSKTICQGVVYGLKKMGIEAEFRPRNDIEVDGRKISGTGGVFEDDALLHQGTLLIDFDVEAMIKALHIPTEKLADKELESARERVTCLKEELGKTPTLNEIKHNIKEGFEEALGITIKKGALSKVELEHFKDSIKKYSSKKWIYSIKEPPTNKTLRSVYKTKGGLIRISLIADAKRKYLKSVLITGDFFVHPRRTILDLEARLKDISISTAKKTIDRFFIEKKPEMVDLKGEDFYKALKIALEKINYPTLGISLEDSNSLFPINGSLKDILSNCSAILLPYCAKLPECGFRSRDGCEKCGRCTIGTAYNLAESKGLIPITIHNYEHLKETLSRLKQEGVKSYIGCCCEAFFVKRHKAFKEVGLPGVLIDIENTTCYELQKESEAYAGKFKNQTNLKLDLLQTMIQRVPSKTHANTTIGDKQRGGQ